MTYCVFDLETQGTKTYKRFCNPLDPNHYIISCAYYHQGSKETQYIDYTYEGFTRTQVVSRICHPTEKETHTLLVGQNVKFDLLWLWGEESFRTWLREGGMVWDTLTVQYLLDGQAKIPRSLGDLAQRYNVRLKMDRVGKLYKAGRDSKYLFDKYPKRMRAYNIRDVEATTDVFQRQLQEVKRRGMLDLVKTYMEHYLAVTEMEYNGIYIDSQVGLEQAGALEKELDELDTSIQNKVRALDVWPSELIFNPASGPMVKALLFGGFVKGSVDQVQRDDLGNPIRYGPNAQRAGEIKTKKILIEYAIEGLGINPSSYSEVTKKPKADEATLSDLASTCDDPILKDLLSALLLHREKNKLLGTYFLKEIGKKKTGMLALIHPDGAVHTEFVTSQTATGRLSSRNPNLQNLPPNALDMCTSRFPAGRILEMDFSQLEVVLQAWITQSTNFIRDIKQGVDFHCKRLSYIVEESYDDVVKLCASSEEWKQKRKNAKIISFQKAYGAQPKSISKKTGLSVELVEQIFKKEDEDYPEISEYYKKAAKAVQMSSKPTSELLPIKIKDTEGKFQGLTTRPGEYQYEGELTTPTNKRYTLKDRGVITSRGSLFRYYQLPEIFDYPIQGTAADIVALFVGNLFRKILQLRLRSKLINEVHDSLIFDCPPAELNAIIKLIKDEVKDLPNLIKRRFNLIFNVPLEVDIQIGDSWGQAKQGEKQ